jgi:NAD(P)-dependent dehydrogenase (short-subunit alcohol dehydrogenase family)
MKGKTVVITGSGRHKGIGEAIALAFASAKCNVIITDIGKPKGNEFTEEHIGTTTEIDEIVEECKKRGGKAIGIVCDVRKANDCENLIKKTVKKFGKIDILINNAGVGYLMEPFTEFKEESWDAVLDVNLKGAFLCSKYAAIEMINAGSGGCIINIASQAAKSGFPYAAAYTASKHGLIGLTRSNAVELGQYGIRVNAVCPNHITTGLGHWQNKFFSEKFGLDYETYLKGIADRNPLKRTGQVDDIAKACLFLASDQAAYITGEAMNVSGGEEYH